MNFILTFKLSWQSFRDISDSSPWQATNSSGQPVRGADGCVCPLLQGVTHCNHSPLIINVKSSGGTGIFLLV